MSLVDNGTGDGFVVESSAHRADIDNQLLRMEAVSASVDVDLAAAILRLVRLIGLLESRFLTDHHQVGRSGALGTRALPGEVAPSPAHTSPVHPARGGGDPGPVPQPGRRSLTGPAVQVGVGQLAGQ